MTIETLKSPNARNRNRGKIEIFIRLFDEHFASLRSKRFCAEQESKTA